MVAPLFPLIALAAAAGAKPFYDNWAAGVRGRPVGEAMDSAGADPAARADALARIGQITPDQLLGFEQQRQQLAQQADQFRQSFGLDQARLSQQASQFGLSYGIDRDRLALDRRNSAIDRARALSGGGDVMQVAQVTPEIMEAAKMAVAGRESGGWANPYDAVGPVTASGDRAYGKYQVMGNNIPQWTKEALGRPVSPEEFLASKDIQEAVFEHRMGGYLARDRNMRDAASRWFTGRPYEQALQETPEGDGWATTAGYVGDVERAFNGQLQAGQLAREREAALRGVEIESDEATAPIATSIERADTVINGMQHLGRIPLGVGMSAEDKAISDQVQTAGLELFYDWKKSIYGEAEPSPVTLEQMQEAFRTPGGRTEDRDRTMRYFQLMRAELEQKQRYERGKIAYKNGLITREEYQSLGRGRLSKQEQQEILNGTAGRPEGFSKRVQ
jgi:hypothetical protein